MPLQDISAVIITRDASRTLERTLDALRAFEEVVVYDNGSADDTVALAGRYPNVSIHRGEFQGFGPTRNRAATRASREWIFSVDADERPDRELLESLDRAALDDSTTVFAVHRENRFMGRAVHRGGWGNEWKRRLYHRGRVAWEPVPVHERLQRPPGQRVTRLEGLLVHDAITDIGQFLDKTRHYSALRAPDLRPLNPALIWLRAVWAFLRSYLLQLGCLAGWRGLVIAWSDANGVFFKYMRAWADRASRRERGDDG